MSLARDARSLSAFTIQSFRTTFFRFRFLALALAVAIFFLLLTLGLTLAAASARIPPRPGAPLWELGANGALTALAFAFAPVLFVVLPAAIGSGVVRRDQTSGYLETALSRSAPRWAFVTGRFLGLFLAVAIVLLIVDGFAVGILGTTGQSLSASLVVGFLGATLLYSGMWLAFSLLLTTFFAPVQVRILTLLSWFAFQAIRSSGLVIGGQFLLIVPLSGPHLFQPGWADWISFTGMLHGAMAPFVPDVLGFVVRPDIHALGDALAYQSVSMAGLVWLAVLLVGHIVLVSRYPIGVPFAALFRR